MIAASAAGTLAWAASNTSLINHNLGWMKICVLWMSPQIGWKPGVLAGGTRFQERMARIRTTCGAKHGRRRKAWRRVTAYSSLCCGLVLGMSQTLMAERPRSVQVAPLSNEA